MGTILPKSISEDTNVETFSLVWLDATIHTSKENIKYQDTLQASINQLKTFDNSVECVKYVKSLPSSDRVILICSGSLGTTTVPQIHALRQIFSIYVFCFNKLANEQWANRYFKVSGVFTRLPELIDQILFDQHSQNHKVDEQMSISIFNAEHLENRGKTESYYHFVYSQILIDSLLQMPITFQEKTELYTRCRAEYRSNKTEIQLISEFENRYSAKQAIWWFTRESFLHKMLNKALQIQNLDLLFLLRYVIRDIQLQIEANYYPLAIDVYRSQLMTKNELQKFKDSFKQFISINSFVSAVHNRQAAISILNKTQVADDIERVLFEIHADGSLEGVKPFSSIKSKSNNDPEEILFSIGSIFQLNDVCLSPGNLWIIRMTLCTHDNPQLQPLIKDIVEQYGDTKTSLNSFGLLLQDVQQYDEAEKYYSRLIAASPANSPRVQEWGKTLEKIFIDKENYHRHLESIDGAIQGAKEKPKINTYNLASKYMDKGGEHRQKGNFKLALEFYQKAVVTLIQSYDERNPQVGRYYNTIASLYEENEDYIEALAYYEKAKTILENQSFSNHPDLSEVYGKIGDMHRNLLHYDQALMNYEKSIEIAERVSISQLPSILVLMKKIALVYEEQKNFERALTYYEKIALLLPATHVDADKNRQNIERVRSQIK